MYPDFIHLTEGRIEEYLETLAKEGGAPGTIHTYRSALRHLYHDLPPEKAQTLYELLYELLGKERRTK